MRLSQLLDPGLRVIGAAWEEVEVTALTADSRAVQSGTLFAALAGSRSDGRAFIDDAVARGAAAVLSDPSIADRACPSLWSSTTTRGAASRCSRPACSGASPLMSRR